jgi:hypothetical protein
VVAVCATVSAATGGQRMNAHNIKLEFEDGSNIDLSRLTVPQARAFVAEFDKAVALANGIMGQIFVSHMIEEFDMGAPPHHRDTGIEDMTDMAGHVRVCPPGSLAGHGHERTYIYRYVRMSGCSDPQNETFIAFRGF